MICYCPLIILDFVQYHILQLSAQNRRSNRVALAVVIFRSDRRLDGSRVAVLVGHSVGEGPMEQTTRPGREKAQLESEDHAGRRAQGAACCIGSRGIIIVHPAARLEFGRGGIVLGRTWRVSHKHPALSITEINPAGALKCIYSLAVRTTISICLLRFLFQTQSIFQADHISLQEP